MFIDVVSIEGVFKRIRINFIELSVFIVFGGRDVFGEFMRKLMRKWSEKRFCKVWELVMVVMLRQMMLRSASLNISSR